MQLLDKLITIQSIRESQPCLSSLLRHKQWFGNVPGCDRNLFRTTSSDLKGNVLFFLPCWRNIFPCNIPQMLLNICQHTIRFIIVFTSAKGQKGPSWISEEIAKNILFLPGLLSKREKKKKVFGQDAPTPSLLGAQTIHRELNKTTSIHSVCGASSLYCSSVSACLHKSLTWQQPQHWPYSQKPTWDHINE